MCDEIDSIQQDGLNLGFVCPCLCWSVFGLANAKIFSHTASLGLFIIGSHKVCDYPECC